MSLRQKQCVANAVPLKYTGNCENVCTTNRSLRGFEMVSPTALRLECGAGAVHTSGQHLRLSSQDEVTGSEGCLGSDLP